MDTQERLTAEELLARVDSLRERIKGRRIIRGFTTLWSMGQQLGYAIQADEISEPQYLLVMGAIVKVMEEVANETTSL